MTGPVKAQPQKAPAHQAPERLSTPEHASGGRPVAPLHDIQIVSRPIPSNGAPHQIRAILSLQRTIGNRATGRLLQRLAAGPIQPQLTVGPADDQYEREADAAADRVAAGKPVERLSRLPAGGISQRLHRQPETEGEEVRTALVHRQETEEEEPLQLARGAHAVQRLCPECKEEAQRQFSDEDEESVQTKATGGPELDTSTAERAMARSGSGNLLSGAIQRQTQGGSSGHAPDETWTPPTSGVVQAWMYHQVDNWHTGATQALSSFRGAVLEDSSIGFWLGLAGNTLWAAGAIFPPAGAVATGLIGVAIATIGSSVQEHRQEAEYQRVQDIYDDLLSGMNDARTEMGARVIPEANRVMALEAFQSAVARRDTAAWQGAVRTLADVPDADDVNEVSRRVERNLYIKYLKERAAWVSHDIFHVPSPHHPGTESEHRHFFAHRIPERVQRRLERIGVDWRRIDELPIPHRHRDLYRREGTVGAIEYWNFDESTDFPISWTEAERREFLSRVPSYLRSGQTGVTH